MWVHAHCVQHPKIPLVRGRLHVGECSLCSATQNTPSYEQTLCGCMLIVFSTPKYLKLGADSMWVHAHCVQHPKIL